MGVEELMASLYPEFQLGPSSRRLFARLLDGDGTARCSTVDFAATLLLLARGERDRRMSLAFQLFDASSDGSLDRSDIQALLKALGNVALAVVHGSLHPLALVCGCKNEPRDAGYSEFRSKILESARARLQQLIKTVAQVEAPLTEELFRLWVEASPLLSLWLDQLGPAFLRAMDGLERTSELSATRQPHPQVANHAAPSVSSVHSTAVHQHALLGDGSGPLQHSSLTPQALLKLLARFSTVGRLGATQTCDCLRELGLPSPLLARHLFVLFDRERFGSVSAVDFATAMLLLCPGDVLDKLAESWAMCAYPPPRRAVL
jgi:hypothetical protein